MHFSSFIFSSFLFTAIAPFGTVGHKHHEHHHDHDHNMSTEVRGLAGVQRCGAEPLTKEERAKVEQDLEDYRALNGGYAVASNVGTINVNVYVHVIYRDDGTGNVSDAMIANQMKVLNDGFAGVAPSFPNCDGASQPASLASPFRFTVVETTRTQNNNWFSSTFNNIPVIMDSLRRGSCSDLNLVIKDSQYLGAATLPAGCNNGSLFNDWAMIQYNTLPGGTSTGYNEGDTATHEVGHWLGLIHTFQNGCSSPGDYVDDTPYESSPANGCPVGRDSCPSAPGNDPIENFMDYSQDCCMSTFSNGQIARMVDQAAIYRNLQSSTTSSPTSVSTSAPTSAPTNAPTSAPPVAITGVLTVGQSYPSTNQAYWLVFQPDGNLVLYGPNGAIWWSGTHNNADTCTVQPDGNVVIYNSGTPTWNSGTFGNPGAYLSVTNTGSLLISDNNGNMLKSYGVERITGDLTIGHKSINKSHKLDFQPDGNLVLYGPNGAIWWSGTHNNADTCTVQPDGNLVIYNSGTPTWNSGTFGNPGAYITVFDTGVFAFYDKEGNMLKSYGTGGNISSTLLVDQPYVSPNDLNYLIFKSDGNLVAYQSGTEFFSSGTSGNGDTCTMQPDGNLVIYNSGTPTWNSGTFGNPGAYLVMTDSGTLAIYNQSGGLIKYYGIEKIRGDLVVDQLYYSPNARHWIVFQGDGNLILFYNGSYFGSTGTSGSGVRCTMQPDGNFVIYNSSGTAIWYSGTSGYPGAYLTVSDSGYMNIHDQSGTIIKAYRDSVKI